MRINCSRTHSNTLRLVVCARFPLLCRYLPQYFHHPASDDRLHPEYSEFQKEKPRSKRMSRHLYDIEKIMDTEFGKSIEDRELYENVVRHRSIFNKVEGVDYTTHNPSSLVQKGRKWALERWFSPVNEGSLRDIRYLCRWIIATVSIRDTQQYSY